MFRKLISNLPYSPALISDIGFYARRLKKEEATRRTAVIFVILTMVFQSLAVFTPPESANASSEQDIIRGGVSSLEDLLIRYDNNEDDLKDIYTAAGVVRSEIAAAKPSRIKNSDDIYVMSRFGGLSASKKEISMSYPKSSGGVGIRYFSPLSAINSSGSKLSGWIGESSSLGWFAIIQSSGSLATKGIPTFIDPNISSRIKATSTLTSYNLTRQSSDNTLSAKSDDKISYTLRQTNTDSTQVLSDFSIRLADSLEYATIFDKGGGSFNKSTKVLSWPQIEIQPGQYEERTFVLQILSEIPSTGIGTSNPSSYDCKLSLVFGNLIKTPIDCPASKDIEGIFTHLPSAGTGLNIGFALGLLVVVIFFYIRNRQLKSEIKIIRQNFNTGII